MQSVRSEIVFCKILTGVMKHGNSSIVDEHRNMHFGTHPLSKLLYRSRRVSEGRSANSGGIVPVSRLRLKSSRSSFCSLLRAGGIVPVKALRAPKVPPSSTVTRFGKSPIWIDKDGK